MTKVSTLIIMIHAFRTIVDITHTHTHTQHTHNKHKVWPTNQKTEGEGKHITREGDKDIHIQKRHAYSSYQMVEYFYNQPSPSLTTYIHPVTPGALFLTCLPASLKDNAAAEIREYGRETHNRHCVSLSIYLFISLSLHVCLSIYPTISFSVSLFISLFLLLIIINDLHNTGIVLNADAELIWFSWTLPSSANSRAPVLLGAKRPLQILSVSVRLHPF